jgi:hypothetical protein
MRIEILHLFPVSFVQDLEPVPLLNGGLNFPARGRTKKENQEKPRIDTDIHGFAGRFSIRVYPWQKFASRSYRASGGGAAGFVFLSGAVTPIRFKNGWTDCLRPRNFSIDCVISRESPGS